MTEKEEIEENQATELRVLKYLNPFYIHDPSYNVNRKIENLVLYDVNHTEYKFKWFTVSKHYYESQDGFFYSEGSNNVLREKVGLNLPLEVKRKPTYNGNAQLIPLKPLYYAKDEKRCNLYLPFEFFEFELFEEWKTYEYTTVKMVFNMYYSEKIGAGFTVKTQEIELTQNIEFIEVIRPLFELMTYSDEKISESKIINNQEEIKTTIHELNKRWFND